MLPSGPFVPSPEDRETVMDCDQKCREEAR